jgi:DNA-binding GntR family transcriptional regulator
VESVSAQFVREAVELAALDDVPAELDPEVVAELRANLDRQRAPGIGLEEFFDLDEAFHHGLLRLSGHERAWSTVVSAKGHLDRARRLGLQETSPAAFADQHVEIFQAVVDGDVPRARCTMRSHLRAVFKDVEKIWQRSPELFASDNGSVPIRKNVVVWQ